MVNIAEQRERNRPPSKYLKAADLQGKRHKVTISAMTTTMLKDRQGVEKEKNIASFEGKEKQFVFNWTNENLIIPIFGEDTDNWVGAEIELYAAPTNLQDPITGKPMPGIHIRVLNSPPSAPAEPYEDFDEGAGPNEDEAQSGNLPPEGEEIPF